MNTTRPVTAGIAVALLGVTAAGTAAFALFSPVLASMAAGMVAGNIGTAAVVIILGLGAVSLGFAAAAAYAARAVHRGEATGTVAGFAVGAVLLLGAGIAALSGGWHPALSAAYLLGGGIVAALVLGLLGNNAHRLAA